MTTFGYLLCGFVLLLVPGAAWLFLRRSRPAQPHPDQARGSTPAAAEPIVIAQAANAREPTEAGDVISPQWLLQQLHWLALDAPAEAAAEVPGAVHARVVAAALGILERIESEPRYIPRKPHLLPQLMRAARDEQGSSRAVAAIIAQDPALAGNLLTIANSPLYRVQAGPIESIERAVTLLGTEGVRLIIAAALVQPVMSGTGSVFGRFPGVLWEHTLLSAAAAAEHARQVENDDPLGAQLLGLLHGLGSIVVVQVLRDEYARHPALEPSNAVAESLLLSSAATAAARIARSWEMSDRFALALDEQRRIDDVASMSPLGRSLRFGRLAAALAMLQRAARLPAPEARAALDRLEPCTAANEVIWSRLISS